MKVLVTGGAGFIGSHVVDAFVARGDEVVVVDDMSSGRVENLNPSATFYKMDIQDPALGAVFEKERPDVVSHHAAQIDVRRSVAEPLWDAQINILGSIALLELARTYAVKRFVYVSTGGAVYGEPLYLPCDEAHPIQAICQYGVSKYTVERYLFAYQAMYGLPYTVLRYPNVYGPRQDPHGEAGVVAIFAKCMLGDERVTIFGDGKQERDFLYVEDCARANVQVVEQDRDGVFNLGTGRGTNINQLFDTLREITHYSHLPIYKPAKSGETYQIYLTADKAKRELGWHSGFSLIEGLEKTIEFFSL